jgi:glutathione S-transferase
MIQLYLWDQCPYCRKVSQAAKDIGLTEGVDYENVAAGPGTPGRLTVQNLGGKTMVPFLVDGDLCMYESADIISYLKMKATNA